MMHIGKVELGKMPVIVGTVSGDLNLPIEKIGNIDVLEVRIDMFKSHEINDILTVIKSVKNTYGKPLLATIRSKAEGGAIEMDDNRRYEIYREVICLVDAIDVELKSSALLKKILPLCKEMGKLLIASYHNNNETLNDAELEQILSEGKGSGADVVKIAVTANSKEDLGRLLSFTVKNRDKGLITISQGSIGTISRIVAPILGSLMTYAYIDVPSAKGQLSAFEVVENLRLFDPEYNEQLTKRAD